MNLHEYGSKTLKRKSTKPKTGSVDHTKNKDDFNGTPGSRIWRGLVKCLQGLWESFANGYGLANNKLKKSIPFFDII